MSVNENDMIAALVAGSGIESDTVAKVLKLMPDVLAEYFAQKDTVAIPRFGTFSAEMEEERITEENGDRVLLPPHIDVKFRPSVLLRKMVE